MIRLPLNTDEVPLVILAAGDYPSAGIAAEMLAHAGKVACCDGAAAEFISKGGFPAAIIGDCDSLSDDMRKRYADIVHCVPDQDTNDLTKAVNYCVANGFGDIVILGATGKREDHTIANIALMAEYIMMRGVAGVRTVSDRAVFDAVVPYAEQGYGDAYNCLENTGIFSEFEPEEFVFESFPGQQVSIFTPIPGVRVTTSGLVYPLGNALLPGWWRATLNESAAGSFSITTTGPAVICRIFE